MKRNVHSQGRMLLIILLLFSGWLPARAQLVSLSLQNEPVEKAFEALQAQVRYKFVYTVEIVKDLPPVSVKLQKVSLPHALSQLLRELPLSYSIEDEYIFIRTKTDRPVASSYSLTGKVTDENNKPIAGVTVLVKESSRMSLTDDKGSFALPNVDEHSTIRFSSIGYQSLEVPLKGRRHIEVRLAVAVSILEEAVIKGYYTTTKRLNTGNVGKLTAEQISKQPVSNPLQALEGRIPGLSITQNTGLPGGAITVRLRGQNSIANGNDPLYIIDGVPFPSTSLVATPYTASMVLPFASPLNNIDPSDIESIEVLKDADATAIYGSRGANGVILITTRKGRAGKTKVDIALSTGIGRPARSLPTLGLSDYLTMRREAFKNDGIVPDAFPGSPGFAPDLMIWDTTRETQWQKELIGGNARLVHAQLGLSGGTARTQFLLKTGYRRESTVFPGDNGEDKASVLFGLNHSTEDQKFNTSLSLSYVRDKITLPTQDLVSPSLMLAPDSPAPYDSTGNLNWGPANASWDNPYAYLLQQYRLQTSTLLSNLGLTYQISKGLQAKANIGSTLLWSDELYTVPKASISPYSTALASARFANNTLESWIIEPQFSYHVPLAAGELSVLAGATFQDSRRKGLVQLASGFSSDELLENPKAAASLTTPSFTDTRYRYNALFARLGYDWKHKYILNLTGRRDGSSRFGPNRQFANFGSLGGAWIFSNEDWAGAWKFLSLGKIRASYGTSGNDQLPDYQYLDSYTPTSFSYQGSGFMPSRLFNPDFAWELNRKFEAGLELGFAKDRLLVSMSYFRNRSSNQLVGYPLPSITGFTSIQYNLPAVVQNTGIETEISMENVRGKHLRWTTAFNLSVPKNKLVAYPGIEGSNYANIYVVGQPLSITRQFTWKGVNPQTGIHEFEDIDGDSLISSPQDLVPGRPLDQLYYGGLQNSLTYKSWQLDVFVQFVKQTGVFAYGLVPGMPGNQPTTVMNRWQKPGTATAVQKFTAGYTEPWMAYATRYLSGSGTLCDASYVRLKNLFLSWTMPDKLVSKLGLQKLKAYVQAQNLLTVTSYPGPDPENQSIYSLPPLRMMTAGIQITF